VKLHERFVSRVIAGEPGFYVAHVSRTQFGGSIYSMTDPHFMYLLLNNLGSEYVVWDRAAKIDFVKPGKTH